jgi:hypothetical protein
MDNENKGIAEAGAVDTKQDILIKTLFPDPENRFMGLPLRVETFNGRNWTLLREVTYRTKAGEVSAVHEGFEFDFASVPRALWWLFPPAGTESTPYGVAALIHDWLCTHREIGGRPITRKEADDLFLEIMLYVKVRKSAAYTMYWAVRAFSWIAWNTKEKTA